LNDRPYSLLHFATPSDLNCVIGNKLFSRLFIEMLSSPLIPPQSPAREDNNTRQIDRQRHTICDVDRLLLL